MGNIKLHAAVVHTCALALVTAAALLVGCGGGGTSGPETGAIVSAPTAPGAQATPVTPVTPTAPVNPGCTAGTVTWAISDKTCMATLPALASGQSLTASSTVNGLMGSATFSCMSGQRTLEPGFTCFANVAPIVLVQATVTGLFVAVTAKGSSDPDGIIVEYTWDFGEAGSGAGNSASGLEATHSYLEAGNFTVTVTATDNLGGTATASLQLAPKAPPALATGRLNDTGIDRCHSAVGPPLTFCSTPEARALSATQDGLVGRDVIGSASPLDGELGFSFTKIGPAGEDLPASATTWMCVRDNVTGLIWEVKTDSGLRDSRTTYTNYSVAFDPNKLRGTPADATGFIAAVNTEGLCGARDWRLPTVAELQGIVHFGKYQPSIESSYFPRTMATFRHWTSTAFEVPVLVPGSTQDDAWTVSFNGGHTQTLARNQNGVIRLVRADTPDASGRWTFSADQQEVTDNQTRLTWRRCPEGMTASAAGCTGTFTNFLLNQALTRANEAATPDKAWRVPNVKELASVVDRSRVFPAIDETIFPRTTGTGFWTSTPYGGNPGNQAWQVDFSIGRVEPAAKDTSSVQLRLVRDAP